MIRVTQNFKHEIYFFRIFFKLQIHAIKAHIIGGRRLDCSWLFDEIWDLWTFFENSSFFYISLTVILLIVSAQTILFCKCTMWKFSYSFRIMVIFYFITWIVATQTIRGNMLIFMSLNFGFWRNCLVDDIQNLNFR